ncbi:MAG: nicotinamide riboside transporter PnuC [Clostridia bacterium]|nr:nicotinamide riboside transporter PnuC [Clostridia bacterium]
MKKPKLRNPFKNLTKFEWALWIISLAGITASFFAVKNDDYATLAVSLIGVTSLIFAAKGDAFGLMLMLAFSAVYAAVSYFFGYYGEMIIYLAMQIPVCTASLISWLKNPAKEGGSETKTGKLTPKYAAIMLVSTVAVTTAFYFILRELNTENLIFSTISVATSFSALFLMVLRVPAYAAVFMLNDVVLIILWSLACAQSLNYVPMAVCFSIFLINDFYGFISWTRRQKQQLKE